MCFAVPYPQEVPAGLRLDPDQALPLRQDLHLVSTGTPAQQPTERHGKPFYLLPPCMGPVQSSPPPFNLLFHLPFTILPALVSPASFHLLQEGGERGGVGLLALTEVEGEISLLLDEEASTLFPLEQLAVCPLKWCAIKLCGRKFDFHETGCVCAMSKVRSLKVSYILGVSGYVCS
jgi:hypothetical protein